MQRQLALRGVAQPRAGVGVAPPPVGTVVAVTSSHRTLLPRAWVAALRDSLLDPVGLDIGDVADTDAAAAEQGVNQGVFGTMRSRFDGQAGAFAYLLFVLLYFPCAATIGAIKREAGTPWAAFVAGWTTLVAYITAASFYQVARFDLHPAASSAWLAGMWSVFALVVFLLRRWERSRPEPASKPARVEA